MTNAEYRVQYGVTEPYELWVCTSQVTYGTIREGAWELQHYHRSLHNALLDAAHRICLWQIRLRTAAGAAIVVREGGIRGYGFRMC